MFQGHSALGENPGLLPDAHSQTQLPSSHSLPAKPQDLHGPSWAIAQAQRVGKGLLTLSTGSPLGTP